MKKKIISVNHKNNYMFKKRQNMSIFTTKVHFKKKKFNKENKIFKTNRNMNY